MLTLFGAGAGFDATICKQRGEESGLLLSLLRTRGFSRLDGVAGIALVVDVLSQGAAFSKTISSS